MPAKQQYDRIVLTSRPTGTPNWDNLKLEKVDIDAFEGPSVIVKSLSLSIDPAMRGWMSSAKSYLPPVAIGEVMRASGIGQVVSSTVPRFKKGDLVNGMLGLQEYSVWRGGVGLDLLDPALRSLPIDAWLSVLGTTGLTAYFGLLKVGLPQPGETLLVSGAAGATGSIVGQIGNLMQCRVVGIAGSDDKCNYLTKELGFDAAINYKTSKSLVKSVAQACPEGVDVFFDNVGGECLDAALGCLQRGARVVLCGAISQYNAREMKGPGRYMNLLVKRARMQGFVVFDYAQEYKIARRRLTAWVKQGKIKYSVQESRGLSSSVDAINSLFTGANTGKVILKLADPTPHSSL